MNAFALRLLYAFLFVASLICDHLHAQSFDLLVTQSPPGPSNQNPATWGGILQIHYDGSGGRGVTGAGVDKSLLDDPAGFVFRGASSEVFVGNRHGNIAASSIARFKYHTATRTLTPNGEITGNGLFGVHQLAINPITGELFAANVNDGISRFTFNAAGEAIAKGKISSGLTRGVAISPDGKRLYHTTAGNVIRQFDLTTGAALPSITLPSRANLHYIQIHRGDLYVAALDDGAVYRFRMDANNDLSLRRSYSAFAPIDLAFSPDGREMFVSGHRESDEIYRFDYDAPNDNWIASSQLSSGSSLGAVLILANQPQLHIARNGENVRISWFLPDEGWVLESAPTLPAANWTTIAGPYEQTFQERFIIRPASASSAFFRLRKL